MHQVNIEVIGQRVSAPTAATAWCACSVRWKDWGKTWRGVKVKLGKGALHGYYLLVSSTCEIVCKGIIKLHVCLDTKNDVYYNFPGQACSAIFSAASDVSLFSFFFYLSQSLVLFFFLSLHIACTRRIHFQNGDVHSLHISGSRSLLY